MTWGERVALMVIARGRVILATTLFLAIAGLVAWMFMPREEDPRIPNRYGLVVVPFPGADAETMERLVVDPIEEHVLEVSEINFVESTSRADVAIVVMELRDDIIEVEMAWERVEDALADARGEFPDGVGRYELDTRLIGDQEAIVLVVSGSVDPMQLLRGAEMVEGAIARIEGVSEVRLIGDPGRQVTIEYDDALARRIGISPQALAQQLGARNQTLPAGSIKLGEQSATLNPRSEFSSLADLRQTAVTLPSGASVALGDLTDVRYGAEEPRPELMRYNGERGVAVSVIVQEGSDVVAIGRDIRAAIDEVRAELAPLNISEISFQPDYVDQRLSDLGSSLLVGISIVACILVVVMGVRLGFVVAAVVPLVALSSLALFAFSGGVLHQMSVAALILALGLLVDNAIVVAESAQQRLEQGYNRISAAMKAIRELAFPLATATGTTVAAFVPMYASEGATGDFTRAIPQVAILTMVLSYIFAVTVTPVLSALFLRPRTRESEQSSRFSAFAVWLSRLAPQHPRKIILGAVCAILLSGLMASFIGQQFFPEADRNQFVVELILAEGSHLQQTSDASRTVERMMLAHPAVRNVSAFVGRSAPRFYYNVPIRPRSPHFANLVVETESRHDIDQVIADLRHGVRTELPVVEVIPRVLAQGPPLDAPIEIRLRGDDLGDLHRAAEAVIGTLRTIDGAVNVRHDLGIGRPTFTFDVDDAAAARHGLSRRDVALALLEQTRGLPVGDLRSGDDPVPILVRSSHGEYVGAERLSTVELAAPDGGLIPLSHVAKVGVEWRPAAIHRRNQERMITVSAQLSRGVTYSEVLGRLLPHLDSPPLAGMFHANAGVSWEIGGAAEGAGDANIALAKAAPLGAILLLFFVLVEFNSFRRLAIILSTVPLAATGIVPGLLLGGQPFGFMSLLGTFALIGVVVNNAIVLLSVVDSQREQGVPVADALSAAVTLRTRPILLTTATTVAGLVPLAISDSQLWPPMAFAMIAGLIASTALTLLVVPALYSLLFRDHRATTGHAIGQLGES